MEQMPWGIKAAIGGLAAGFVLLVGGFLGEGAVPHTCTDITARQLTHVYEGHGGLMGNVQFIDITNARDAGSSATGLRCKIAAVTTHGDMKFDVSTRVIRGETYIYAQPDLGLKF